MYFSKGGEINKFGSAAETRACDIYFAARHGVFAALAKDKSTFGERQK